MPTSLRTSKLAAIVSAVAIVLLAMPTALGFEVELIVSTLGATSDIGITDEPSPGEIRSRPIQGMESFSISADGNWWAGKFDVEFDTPTDAVHLRGQGSAITDVIWQAGVTPFPAPYSDLTGNISHHSLSFETSINNNGLVAGAISNSSSNLSGEPNSFIYTFDGSAISIVAAAGETIPAYPNAQYGDFLFGGQGQHGVNVLNNGQAAFLSERDFGADLPADYGVAVTNNGTTAIGPQLGVTAYPNGTLERWDQSDLVVTPDGTKFLFQGETDAAVNADDIIVYGDVGTNGTAVLQENVTPIGGGTFDSAWLGSLAPNGDWYAIGGLTDGFTHVAIKNGELLAKSGDPAPNGFNYGFGPNGGNAGGAIDGNSHGNYIWIWGTNNPDTEADELLVYNGDTVLLAEGDTISLDFGDGNGLTDVIVDEFKAFDGRIGDNGWVYLFVQLDSMAGNNLAEAFIRLYVDQEIEVLAGDYNLDGRVDTADYTRWRDNLGAAGSTLGDGRDPSNLGVVNAQDYAWWKANFGANSGAAFASQPASVPEPSSLVVVLTCLSAIAGHVICGGTRRNTCD